MPKRRRYLINPRFQLAFIAYNVGVALILGATFYGAVRYFFWKLAGFGKEAGLAPDHVFFQFLSEQVRLMNVVFAVTLLVTVAVLALHGLFLSHKVAGPLYRLRSHMLKIASGAPPSPVKFREKDFFHDLADAYNAQVGKADNHKAA